MNVALKVCSITFLSNYTLDWGNIYDKTPNLIGKHIDAPCHFHKDRWKVAEIPLERLVGPAVVVNIASRALDDPDTFLNQADLEAWEDDYTQIPEGAIVLMNSGWDAYWPNKTAIFGNAIGDTSDLHFPGFDPQAVDWLIEERGIAGIGVDTPSTDHDPSTSYGVHAIVDENNVYGLENVKSLGELPPSGHAYENRGSELNN